MSRPMYLDWVGNTVVEVGPLDMWDVGPREQVNLMLLVKPLSRGAVDHLTQLVLHGVDFVLVDLHKYIPEAVALQLAQE